MLRPVFLKADRVVIRRAADAYRTEAKSESRGGGVSFAKIRDRATDIADVADQLRAALDADDAPGLVSADRDRLDALIAEARAEADACERSTGRGAQTYAGDLRAQLVHLIASRWCDRGRSLSDPALVRVASCILRRADPIRDWKGADTYRKYVQRRIEKFAADEFEAEISDKLLKTRRT